MKKHPYISNEKNQVFTQPFFDLISIQNWNEELPGLYERINTLNDDRSFILLMAIVLEHHLDTLLKALFPDFNQLIDHIDVTFSLKTLRIIPNQIFRFIELVRKFRNIFAHNLSIDSIEDLKRGADSEKKLYTNLEQICIEYEDSLVYSRNSENDFRMKYKDIASIAIHALREYEPNFVALRKHIDHKDFEKNLSNEFGNKLHDLKHIE